MNITEKRSDIIKIINQTDDENLINEIYALVHDEPGVEKFNLQDMSSELRKKLTKAIDDYKTGNYITHEQMKEKIESWRMK